MARRRNGEVVGNRLELLDTNKIDGLRALSNDLHPQETFCFAREFDGSWRVEGAVRTHFAHGGSNRLNRDRSGRQNLRSCGFDRYDTVAIDQASLVSWKPISERKQAEQNDKSDSDRESAIHSGRDGR